MITKIVKKILEKYKDANLESEAAREKIAKEIGFLVKILPLDDREAAKLYGSNFVLVRPDLMVAWRANELPERPKSILDIVRGEQSPQPDFSA